MVSSRLSRLQCLHAWRLVTCCRSSVTSALWDGAHLQQPTPPPLQHTTTVISVHTTPAIPILNRLTVTPNMAPLEEMHAAMVNRSIRTIKAVCPSHSSPSPELHLTYNSQELEYLTDAGIITPQTLSDLLQRMPQQTPLHAPISVGAVPTPQSQAGTIQPPPTTAPEQHEPTKQQRIWSTEQRL